MDTRHRRLGRFLWAPLLLGLLVGAGAIPSASAQTPPPCTESPAHPPIPMLPPRAPLPLSEVSRLVDSPSANDASVEVIVGQARVLTLRDNVRVPNTIAVGDPSVLEFNVLNPRQLRLVGQRIGVTDLSVVADNNRVYSFEVHVVADLDILRSRIRSSFPDASVKITQMRDHVILEGEVRDSQQMLRVVETVRAFLISVQSTELRKIRAQRQALPGVAAAALSPAGGIAAPPPAAVPGTGPGAGAAGAAPGATGITPELVPLTEVVATVPAPEIINLLRVPGSHQVLLKVRVAELNRTAMREIGADFLAIDPSSGAIIGTQIGGAAVATTATASNRLVGSASNSATPRTTAFGIFQKGDFDILFSALRRNNLLKILAEPNLMAMNGHIASFLAGGQFPVPVSQSATGGTVPPVTVQFQKFGVELEFTPYILDNDTIRLTVRPTVSSVDFSLGTVLVPGGTPVPGLNTREAFTTVELHEGQTLAIAGLLQLTIDSTTSRIPGLGDLPILGPFFSNTTGNRMEKELIVLVTPYLVEPMNPGDVPPTPGDEVREPSDLEFYLFNHIESRYGRDFRSTTQYDEPLRRLNCFMKLQKEHVHGAYGYCP